MYRAERVRDCRAGFRGLREEQAILRIWERESMLIHCDQAENGRSKGIKTDSTGLFVKLSDFESGGRVGAKSVARLI